MLDRDPEALEALLAESLTVLMQKSAFVTPTVYERIGRCLKGLSRPGAAAYFAQAAQKTLPTPYDLDPLGQRLDAGVFALWADDQALSRTLLTEVVAKTRLAVTWQDRERFVIACWFLRWDEDIVQRVPHWHAQDEAQEGEDVDTHYPAYVMAQLALALLQQDSAAFAEALTLLAELIQDDSDRSYATTGGVSLWDIYDWALLRQTEFEIAATYRPRRTLLGGAFHPMYSRTKPILEWSSHRETRYLNDSFRALLCYEMRVCP